MDGTAIGPIDADEVEAARPPGGRRSPQGLQGGLAAAHRQAPFAACGWLRRLRAPRLLLSPLAGWNSVVASERSGEGVRGGVAGAFTDLREG